MCWTGCLRLPAGARARSYSYGVRPGSARRRSSATPPGRLLGSEWPRSRASRPRWNCRSRGCTACARRCSPSSTRFLSPQQTALRVSFGLSSGDTPDRFLVALAALTLFAEVAEERPLLCLVDDAQWLDAATSQVLGFIARRLLAESVAIVFTVREPSDERELGDLPKLSLGGLRDDDARVLLSSVIPGRLDDRVRDRLVAEARGNPLALVELPRGRSIGRAGRRLRAARRRERFRAKSRTTSGNG